MLTRLKHRVQSLLATQARWLHSVGMTPNKISLMGIFSAFLSGYFYWMWWYNHYLLIVAPIFLLLSGFCDALDGVVARLHGEISIFGGFLDSLLDRYADALVIVALIGSGLCNVFWGSVALVGSLLVSYARARAEATGAKMETIGLAERSERIIILTIASFVSFYWLDALNWSIILLAVLTNLTVLQRSIYFYKTCEQKEG
ncbi:MAG: archaetidylinositol phosphate synthase [Candidatus Bathyarchaeia archaeon]